MILFIYNIFFIDYQMGDTFSSQKQANFIDKIQYLESVEDRNFDKLDIYRIKDPPSDYILDFKKHYVASKEIMSNYISLMDRLKKMQHQNLAKIHACSLKEQKQLCIIHHIAHTYCHYYNFTLSDAIQKKKNTKNIFSEADLLYIMLSLVDVIAYLKQYKVIFGQFRPQSIYLSPEGHIKLYLLDVDVENRHSAYFKVLAENKKLTEYILSPEQLTSMKRLEYQTKYDEYKSDLFAVGMVMLELITLDAAKFYYNPQKMEIMINKANFSLEIYSHRYSKPFLDFIKRCIEPDVAYRPTPEEALATIKQMRSASKNNIYCIRLEAQQNKEKLEENGVKPKGQYILNSLAKKLNPSPISTISSSSASLFKTSEQQGSFRNNRPHFQAFIKE